MTTTTDVQMFIRGDVGERDKQQAREAIRWIADRTAKPIPSCRLKLRLGDDQADPTPATAQASISLNGRPVRAVAVAATMSEAIRLMQERLRHQIEHASDRLLARRQRGAESPEPSEWRHGDLPTRRPPFYPRPVEEREIVRHKTYAVQAMPAEDAIEEMLLLDYDFHLYRDARTNLDSVVAHRHGKTIELSLDDPTIPALSQSDATEWLDLTDEPWLFFRHKDTDRGAVAYRRYDGHYGLIEPRRPGVPGSG